MEFYETNATKLHLSPHSRRRRVYDWNIQFYSASSDGLFELYFVADATESGVQRKR